MNNFIFGDRGWTGWTIYRKDNSHIQAKKLSENVVFFGWGGSIYIYMYGYLEIRGAFFSYTTWAF